MKKHDFLPGSIQGNPGKVKTCNSKQPVPVFGGAGTPAFLNQGISR
jgi:hypothetical protein